jgi:hypothetical protein
VVGYRYSPTTHTPLVHTMGGGMTQEALIGVQVEQWSAA